MKPLNDPIKEILNRLDNIENYELNKEIKIGKWIHGEDLYQMTIGAQAPQVNKDGTLTERAYSIEDLNISNLKDCYIKEVWIRTGSQSLVPVPYLINNQNIIEVFYRTSNQEVVIQSAVKEYSNCNMTIVLMYTKNN